MSNLAKNLLAGNVKSAVQNVPQKLLKMIIRRYNDKDLEK